MTLGSLGEEAQRVMRNVHCEVAPPVEVRVIGKGGNDPDVQLERIREVMKVVAQQRGAGTWPKDAWWESNLPNWFLDPFKGRTIDEVLRNPELWDFGSWLDAMRYTGWEWWSSGRTKQGWVVRVQATADPYSIEPLEYLGRAAGAAVVLSKN